MSNVVPFGPRRVAKAKPEPTPPARQGIAVALQASPGAVTMIVGTADDGAEVWMSPDEAYSLGEDLKRFALSAGRLDGA